ncbi:MOSC domain-containing protein [Citreimonas sp.]|uniref:MOSC domain-containing protein n=1 Tax=Citreimonas sp. TaxID=3036715 RepID=UPI00405A2A36
MPALKPTDHIATITWLGLVPTEDTGLRAVPRDTLTLDWGGPVGERHGGLTRASCSRVTAQYTRGTEIANVRQLSVLSAEEIAATAEAMGLDALDPAWLGATLVVQGIADFSHLPPSSRLQSPDGTCLVIDMQNRPCVLPGREIEAEHEGHGKRFKRAAEGRRGVTAWVERPGTLNMGDTLRLFVPDQRAWQGGV